MGEVRQPSFLRETQEHDLDRNRVPIILVSTWLI